MRAKQDRLTGASSDKALRFESGDKVSCICAWVVQPFPYHEYELTVYRLPRATTLKYLQYLEAATENILNESMNRTRRQS